MAGSSGNAHTRGPVERTVSSLRIHSMAAARCILLCSAVRQTDRLPHQHMRMPNSSTAPLTVGGALGEIERDGALGCTQVLALRGGEHGVLGIDGGRGGRRSQTMCKCMGTPGHHPATQPPTRPCDMTYPIPNLNHPAAHPEHTAHLYKPPTQNTSDSCRWSASRHITQPRPGYTRPYLRCARRLCWY